MRNKITSRLITTFSFIFLIIALAITALFSMQKNIKTSDKNEVEIVESTVDLSNKISVNDMKFSYNTSDKTAVFIGLAKGHYTATLEIPESVQGSDGNNYTVTSIDPYKNLTELIIYTNPTSKENLFATSLYRYGSNINALVIPSTVTNIVSGAFYGMARLEYFKTPFVGQKKGIDSTTPTDRKSLHSMFSLGYQKDFDSNYQPQYKAFNNSNDTTQDDSSLSTNPSETYWYSIADTNKFYYTMPNNLKEVVIYDESKLQVRTFLGIKSLEKVLINDDLETIGEYAFAGCSNLKSVSLKVSTLPEGLFSQCFSLTEFTIPNGVSSVSENCFAQCESLEKALMPTSVTSIGNKAFYLDEQLSKIELYKLNGKGEIEVIESKEQFNLPAGLKNIGANAFAGCNLLTSISIPKEIESIGEDALGGCYDLTEITLPFIGASKGKSSIVKENMFGYIFGTNVNAGAYAATQGENSFCIPENLRTITITGETYICQYAFANLSYVPSSNEVKGVETIIINNVENIQIESGIFAGSAALKNVTIPYIPSGSAFYTLFGTTSRTGLYSIGRYYVPNNFERVTITNQETFKAGSFYYMTSLKYVELGIPTKRIEGAIFYNNQNLEEIVIPFVGYGRGDYRNHNGDARYWYWRDRELRNMFMWIFSGEYVANTYAINTVNVSWSSGYRRYVPNSLKKVTITDDTTIDYYSLRNFSSLTDLTIKKASYISEGAIGGCYKLERLTVPFIGMNANENSYSGDGRTMGWIFGTSSSGTKDYPTYAAYQNSKYYYIPQSLKSIVVTGNVRGVTNDAFANMSNVESIDISNCQTTLLGTQSFMNCKKLHTIKWHEDTNITVVPTRAFMNCYKVTTIKQAIPSIDETQVTVGERSFAGTSISEIDFTRFISVGNRAFAECLRLTEVNVTPNLKSFGEGVFENCSYLTKATISEGQATKQLFRNCISLTTIDLRNKTLVIPSGMFEGCISLEYGSGKLEFSEGVTDIQANAFAYCTSLTNFILPTNTINIGDGVFFGCDNLEPIIIPKEVKTIGKKVFTENIGNDFCIYVYYNPEEWPTGWSTGWNCINPVYTMPPRDDYVYIFEFDEELVGYKITGIKPGIELSGNVLLPEEHNSIPVKGITENVFKNQGNVKQIMVPDTYELFGDNCFNNNTRINLYFEDLKTSSNLPNSDKLKRIMFKGIVLYGDSWELKGASTIPYVKLSSIQFNFDKKTLYYNTTAQTQDIVRAQLKDNVDVVENGENDDLNKIIFDKNIGNKEIFNYEYKNNIQAGTAYVNVTLNSSEYNKYLKADSYAFHFTGTAKPTYTIQKSQINLYYNDISYLTNIKRTYSPGEYWSNSVWGTSNFVSSLYNDLKFKLTGTLRVNSENAGTYEIFGQTSNEMFYWSKAPRVTYNGKDITSNFQILVYLNVEVSKLEVDLKWTGGKLNDTDSVYEYQYTGQKITPTAMAYVKESGIAMPNCNLNITVTNGDNAIKPSNIEYDATCEVNDNNYFYANGNITTKFRIVKRKLTVRVEYGKLIIAPDAERIELSINEDFTSVEGDITNLIRLEGLQPGSNFDGKIISKPKIAGGSAHDSGLYTSGEYNSQGANDSIVWLEQKYIGENYNGTISPNLNFLITRGAGKDKIIENDYYDVSLEASINLVYDKFEVEYSVKNLNTGEITVLTNGVYEIVNNQRYLVFNIPVDGYEHEFSGNITNISDKFHASVFGNTEKVKQGYSYAYYYDGDDPKNDPYKFTNLGAYHIGYRVNSGTLNIDDYYQSIRIVAVKSDVTFNSLDKEYDGQPVSLDGFIKKSGEIPNKQQIELKIYDQTKTKELMTPPSVPGTYYVYVNAQEHDFFNAFDGFVKFVISPRTIDLYVDRIEPENIGSNIESEGFYNGLQKKYVIDDARLHASGAVLSGDTFTGTLLTKSSKPGVYDSSVPSDWYWLSGWSVFNDAGYDYTSYYRIKLHGSYTIKEKIIDDVTVTGFDDYYDAAYHNLEITVKGITDYDIYYTMSEVNEKTDNNFVKWLSFNPSFIDVGYYKIYFKIVKENYKTYYGFGEINIKEKEIVYTKPADILEDTDGNYYINYDGLNHYLEIIVSDPIFSTVYYKLDDGEYTTDVPIVKEPNTHTLAYKIVARNYKTVTGSYTFSVTDKHLNDPSSLGIQILDSTVSYDGLGHTIKVDTNGHEATEEITIYYHLDGETNWKVVNPSFVDAGIYKIHVRVCIIGYQFIEKVATLTIEKIDFTDISFNNYVGVFDGKYHGITINGLDNYEGIKVYYTNNSNILGSQSSLGWSETPIVHKNVGSYVIYVMISLKNYNTKTHSGYVTIEFNSNVDINFEDGYEIEYKKEPITVSDLGVTTVHDGLVIPKYYNATYNDSTSTYSYDPDDLIQAPTELGIYHVILQYKATSNCAAKMVEFYFRIVPRKLEIKYTKSVEYTGQEQSPSPTVETGTSDKLIVLFARKDGVSTLPIEIGVYDIIFSFTEDTKNYEIINPNGTFEITKIKLLVEFETKMDYDYANQSKWSKNSNWEEFKFTEKLLKGHKIDASMSTNGYQRGTYVYTTLNDNKYVNVVVVEKFGIIMENTTIDVSEYYDIEFNIIVEIKFPDIDAEVKDNECFYDGDGHTIKVEINNNIGNISYEYADEIDYKNGNWNSSILTYKDCGKYKIYVKLTSPSFNDFVGYAYLTINKAKVEFTLDPFNEIYDGSEYNVSYSMNIKTINRADVDIRYYPKDKTDILKLNALYKNLDKDSDLYKSGLTSMVNAGEYYVAFFTSEDANWINSYQIDTVTLKQREVLFTISTPYIRSFDYDGNKKIYSLSQATMDESSFNDIKAIQHNFDKLILKYCSVRTISPNSSKDGYKTYFGDTGFEFNEMIITNQKNENVYFNFKPVFKKESLQITINSIQLTQFDVIDTLKEFDGNPANPDIITPSDGEVTYTYFKVDSLGNQTLTTALDAINVGEYYVLCQIGAGTNYFAWSGSKGANVTIIPKKVTLTWSNLQQEFNGQGQMANATYNNVFGFDINAKVEAIVQGDIYSTVVNANLYEVYATIDDSNYELVGNSYNAFEITKIKYNIDVTADYYVTQTVWVKEFNEEYFKDQNIIESLVMTNKTEDGLAKIKSKTSNPGTYYTNADFEYDIKIMSNGVDVTESVSFDVLGELVIHSKEIEFTARDIEIEYDGKAHTVWDALVIENPSKDLVTINTGTTPGEYVNGVLDYVDVGVYTIYFKLTASDYEPKMGQVTIEITLKEAFLNLGSVRLDKEYDNIQISDNDILSKVTGNYNGTSSSDLKVTYYELGSSTPLTSAPYDAGEYEFVITCINDTNPDYIKNYTNLEARKTFTISPKKIKLTVNKDIEIIKDTPTTVDTGSVKNTNGLVSYATLTYQIQSVSALPRGVYKNNENLFTYDTTNQYTFYSGESLFDLKQFKFTWTVVASNRKDSHGNDMDVSFNYMIELDFTATIHLPYLDITIDDVVVDYDGNAHYGSINPIDYTHKYSGIKSYFNESIIGDTNALTPNQISDVKYTNPGSYKVYYKFESENFEPLESFYIITINKLTRTVTIKDTLDKEYDGIKLLSSGVNYSIGYDSMSLTDNYNSGEVEKYFQKEGNSTIFDYVLNAGKYKFIIIIPESDNYIESKEEIEFVVSRKTIYMNGTPTYKFNNKNPMYSDFTPLNGIFGLTYSDKTIVNDLEIKGVLTTTSANKGTYTGREATVYWNNGDYEIFTNDAAMLDVSMNYQIDISNVVIEILPGEIEYFIGNTTFEYAIDSNTNKAVSHKVDAYSTSPVGATVLYSKDGKEGSYKTKEDFEGFSTVADKHQLFIKFSYPNYDDKIVEVIVTINKAKLTLDIPSLSKQYDGQEVLLVEGASYTTNCPELSLQMLIENQRYNEYDPKTDSWMSMGDKRPLNVGTYQLEIILGAIGNYEGRQFTFKFEITAMDVGVKWDSTTFVYNGTSQVPKPILYNNIGQVITDLNYTFKTEKITAPDDASINVGGYRLTIALTNASDYYIEAKDLSVNYSIIMRNVKLELNMNTSHTGSVITLPYGINGFSASGLVDNHHLNTTQLQTTASAVGNYSVYDPINKDNNQFIWLSSTNMPVILDASSNDVTSNYNISYDLHLQINYNQIQASHTNYEGYYDGLPHTAVVTVHTLGEGFTILYSSKYSTNPSDYKNEVLYFTNVGVHEIYYMISKEGYTPLISNTPAYVTIKKANANLVLDDPYLVLTKTYDGIPISNPNVTCKLPKEKIQYNYYKIDDEGNIISTKLEGSIVNVGKYRLKITVEGGDNYENGEIIKDFEIFKREVIITHSRTLGTESMNYNGRRWQKDVNSSDIKVTNLVSGHRFSAGSIIQTKSVNAGKYTNASDFEWQNSKYQIITSDEIDVTSNYIVEIQLHVTISEIDMNVTTSGFSGSYDGKPHSITVIVNDPVEGATIEYSLKEDSDYSTTLITRTYVGTTVVYFRISAPNYKTFKSEALIQITGKNNTYTLDYKQNIEYNGQKYPTPTVTTASTGERVIKYYNSTDTLLEHPLKDAPIDAGSYFFTIVVETDGINEEIVIEKQSFIITPKQVNVSWSNLAQEYTGEPLIPTASFEDINGTSINLVIKSEINNMIAVNDYNVSVTTTDSNYKLVGSTNTFTIYKKAITEPQIQDDMEFEYGSDIIIKDIYGNIYELDVDGNIISITKINDPDNPDDDVLDEDINLPYKFIISPDMNADGVVVEKHTLTIELTDKDNYEWEAKKNSNDLEIDYVITPYDIIKHNDKYELSIAISGQSFQYTGDEIKPIITINIIDKNTRDKVAQLYEKNATDIPSDRFANFELEYKNNINITPTGEYATVSITGINNITFSKEMKFTILEKAPEKITLTDSATMGFIKVNNTKYDDGGMITEIIIDDVERKEAKEKFIYLGRLHQNTYISDILIQLANELKLIKVYNSGGQLIDSASYDSTYFGSGYKIVLIDEKTNLEVDSIEAVLFGDLNGDGMINVVDVGQYSAYLSGSQGFDEMGIFYYALFTSLSQTVPNAITFGLLSNMMSSNDPSTDFNINYTVS